MFNNKTAGLPPGYGQTNKSDGLINAASILRKSERIFFGENHAQYSMATSSFVEESRTTLEIVELLATSSTLEAIKCVELCPVESSLLTTIFAMYLLQRSSSNRIIHAKDHASIQINIAEVDPATGRMTETSKMYAICGAIRRMGESDDCINRLAKKDGVVTKNF
uniref:Small ribosomal subunit protein eS21 n=3 Tax=Timema TaxID=61471 RepID=A0A7R9H851_TIMPO|nr:unnamed protein product [Timema poppensis]